MGLTWGDVRAFASEALSGVELSEKRVAGAIAGQPVALELTRAFDEPWLLLSSPVVPEGGVTRPIDALRWSAALAVGGLVILDHVLVVRASFCLAELDAAGLDRYARFVAREANRLSRLHESWGPPARAVDFMVD